MTNLSAFTNPQTLSDGDPCPICGTLHKRGKDAIFCSVTCTGKANTLRRKLITNFVRFNVLGFRLTFIDCTFPQVHIPDYMTRFYPVGQTSFHVVPPYMINDVEHLSIATFTDIIFDEIGEHASLFIRNMNIKGKEDIHEFRKRYLRHLQEGLQTKETHFICPECNVLYLEGELTHKYSEHRCESCSMAALKKHPF